MEDHETGKQSVSVCEFLGLCSGKIGGINDRTGSYMVQKIKTFWQQNQLWILVLVGGIAFFGIIGKWKSTADPCGSFSDEYMDYWNDAAKYLQGIQDHGSMTLQKAGTQEEFQPDVTQDITVKEDLVMDQEQSAMPQVVSEIAEPKSVTWRSVEEGYFDDALFIGDSRVVGLQDYGKFGEQTTFYASTGLNIFRLLSAKIALADGQLKKISVEEALGQKQFGKIYLMVGINELDIGTVERFEETYRQVISRIQELQPSAIIYIQSIMRVTEKRSSKGDYVKNASIDERNAAIEKIADNEKVFYVNVNEAVCDESGALNPSYTSDGVHLKVKYIPLWKEYLMAHAIVRE